jgi:NAD(P)-dependent dehydrogenase (short-subunit alcohol dehydrogenase family)
MMIFNIWEKLVVDSDGFRSSSEQITVGPSQPAPPENLMTAPLANQTIAVFGASSGIGLAVARGAHALGARVIAVGRDRARLAAAVGELPLQLAQADIADEAQVAALLRDVGALDHVVVTAGSVVGPSPIAQLDFDVARDAIATKLQGSLLVAKHAAARLRAGGSIGFTTGLLGRKIAANTLVKTVINAGLEAAVRQLARELAPLRVYGVSPGPVDTPNWGSLSDEDRRARAAKLASTLPVGFMATADDTAQAYLFAMQARALTGTVIDLDSGAMIGA